LHLRNDEFLNITGEVLAPRARSLASGLPGLSFPSTIGGLNNFAHLAAAALCWSPVGLTDPGLGAAAATDLTPALALASAIAWKSAGVIQGSSQLSSTTCCSCAKVLDRFWNIWAGQPCGGPLAGELAEAPAADNGAGWGTTILLPRATIAATLSHAITCGSRAASVAAIASTSPFHLAKVAVISGCRGSPCGVPAETRICTSQALTSEIMSDARFWTSAL
jgi:hypothetical protein